MSPEHVELVRGFFGMERGTEVLARILPLETYHRIFEAYAENGRYYHGINHLIEVVETVHRVFQWAYFGHDDDFLDGYGSSIMFDFFSWPASSYYTYDNDYGLLQTLCHEYIYTLIAAAYHDVIIRHVYQSPEKKSASVCGVEIGRPGVLAFDIIGQEGLQYAKDLITRTQYLETNTAAGDNPLFYADLKGFLESSQEFKYKSELIQKEALQYHCLPLSDFTSRRLDFLATLRQRIARGDIFGDLDSIRAAQSNITREAERLMNQETVNETRT